MENYKNLLEVIEKSNEEISYYLEDVSVEQFKKDVLENAYDEGVKRGLRIAISVIKEFLEDG